MDFGKVQIKFNPFNIMVIVDKDYIDKIDEGCYISYIDGLTDDNYPNLFIKKENEIFEITEIINSNGYVANRTRKYDYKGNLLFHDLEDGKHE